MEVKMKEIEEIYAANHQETSPQNHVIVWSNTAMFVVKVRIQRL